MSDIYNTKENATMDQVSPNVNLTGLEFIELMNLTADALSNIQSIHCTDEVINRLFEVAQLTVGIYLRSPRQHELVGKGCTPCVEQAGSPESSSEQPSPPLQDGQPLQTSSPPSIVDEVNSAAQDLHKKVGGDPPPHLHEIPQPHIRPIVPESPKVIVPGSQAELAQLQQAERAKQTEQDNAASGTIDDDTNT